MWAIDSRRARVAIAAGWLVFATANTTLMYLFPGAETIPFHLVWASFAFVYGITEWPRAASWPIVAAVIIGTGIALVHHAAIGEIKWEECSEIILMPLIVGLLVWHVDRGGGARRRLAQLRTAEQHRAAQRELATRFGSHEIRTRLTIARGLVDLIGDDDESPAWTVRDCRLAAAELDKATKITNNLMAFVRAEDSTLPMVEVDLDAMLDAISLRWRSSAVRDWEVRGRAGVQLCDPERFEAAVDCMVENAVKFTDDGDRIVISAYLVGPARETLVMAVSDSGTGIPPEDLDRVTELFHTSASAGGRAGTGIGLAIVRAMAEARGGTIEIASTPGRGTTVSVLMPARPVGRRRAPGTSQPVRALATHSSL
ncbi:MAG TPA: HAMP domain-containing sensor histidine kinase [Jatrophihabitans sp.]|jgi:signal transduction histidine kinase